ncbi:MAG TPA: N-acetylmuramoyl-L-alanine amidase [Vicinamibacterales bacterium]|nr:N-acetylmuramoyl-L-alanine amidase [Vicinamibacterales bacterium]
MKVRVQAAALIAAACCLSIVLPAQQPSSAPYTVVSREARRPLPVRVVSGQEMFALDDLARLFNLTVREDTAAGALTVTAGTQTIVLSPQQPLASVAGRMISLPVAPVRDGRAWFVPVDFVSRALAPGSATRIELRKPSRLVLTGDIRMPRVAARVEPLGSLTRVTIDVAPSTPHTVSQEGSRLIVRFDADALDPGDLRVPAPTETLQAIRPGDTPQTLALDLGPRFASFRAADQAVPAGGTRIVIDLQAQTEAAPPGAPQPQQPAPPAPPAPGETPPLLDLPPPGGLRTIVIDAGHGGDDAGARGAQGTLEKNVTLSVARRLKGSIEARLGVRVLLTRDGDGAVPADQRAALANNNKADLFISLHANASVRPGVAGAEVFYLSLEGYGAPAQRPTQGSPEALPVVGGGVRTIEITPWEMAQTRHVPESTAFARAMEAALRERGVPMSARALQQAPFRVLVGANMPAVLVEMGFLTNAQDEQRLAGDGQQNALVQALLDGILRYRSTSPSAGTR